MKVLWIKQPYLEQILAGAKTIEVRVGYPNILRLRAGDPLKLNDQHVVTIRRIARYDSFADLLAHEDPARIAPGLSPDELLAALREIYPPEKEALGVVALELASPEVKGEQDGQKEERGKEAEKEGTTGKAKGAFPRQDFGEPSGRASGQGLSRAAQDAVPEAGAKGFGRCQSPGDEDRSSWPQVHRR